MDERAVDMDGIAALLASTLGQDKSREVVASSVTTRGCGMGPYTASEVRAIFADISRFEGLPGAVARFVVSRGDVEALIARSPRSSSSSRVVAAPPQQPSAVDIVPLLAPALGAEKARDVTEAAAARLGLDVEQLDKESALRVLDDLVRTKGIVGVVARFAKARFLLA